MGRILIINGADFSANRVEKISVWEALPIVDKMTISTSGSIGNLTVSNYKCVSEIPLLVKSGETISIKGMATANCEDSGLEQIEVRFVLYKSAMYSSEQYVNIGLNEKLSSDTDEVSYTNDTGSDIYIGFTYGLPWRQSSEGGVPDWSFANAKLKYRIS